HNDDTLSAISIGLATQTDSTTPDANQTTTALATESPNTDCAQPNQPLAVLISNSVGVSYDEVISWHCKGFGFGEIIRAYLLAQKTSLTVDQVLGMRAKGQGWGKIMKASGVNPKDLAPGSVIKVTKGKGNNPKGTPPGKGKGKGDNGD